MSTHHRQIQVRRLHIIACLFSEKIILAAVLLKSRDI